MKPYSYAFGDHSLFLRKYVSSHRTLELAFKDHRQVGTLIHVYEGSEYSVAYDGNIGGRLVLVIEFSPLLERVMENKKPWVKRPGSRFFDILDRYIRLVVRCRLKERV